MPDFSPFDHEAYRPVLRAWIDASPARSQTTLAQRAGVARSTVAMVLADKREIPVAQASRWADALGLEGDAHDYFVLLVRADSPLSLELRRQARTQAAALRDARRAIRPTLEQARLLGNWLVPVLIELARQPGFTWDAASLAARVWPPVSDTDVAAALDALRELGLLVSSADGVEVRARPIATAPQLADELSRIGRAYHHDQIAHAARALEEQDSSQRFVASLAVGVASRDLPALRETLQRFQLEVIEPLRARADADAVVQVSVQMFGRTLTPT